MENKAVESVQALVVAFESLDKEELQKQKRKLIFYGDVVEVTGKARIIYKPVKSSDDSTELQPLMVSWTDNGLDYTVNLMDYGND